MRLKQYRQLSYEELAFHLEDSASFRAFARLPWAWSPKKSVLHKTISAIRAETWEAINRGLLASARREKIEDGLRRPVQRPGAPQLAVQSRCRLRRRPAPLKFRGNAAVQDQAAIGGESLLELLVCWRAAARGARRNHDSLA